jgi:ABC-2 type transport system permease protein
MNKTFHVALREFLATVATKGFIIGVMITPLIIAIMIPVMRILMNRTPPRVVGQVAIVDPTDRVHEGVGEYLDPERIARRWDLLKDEALEAVPGAARSMAEAATSSGPAAEALAAVMGQVPDLELVRLPEDVDLEAEKAPLREGSAQDGGLLAVVVIAPDAVEKAPDAESFGRYELFVREKLDDRIEDEIKGAVRDSIVAARFDVAGYDRSELEQLGRVGRVRSKTVTDKGETETNEVLNALLPAGFMILLLVSVLTSGQQIMTTTIEEKSSRVVELILSAVSPMQMMAGKILGQMAAGMLILLIYSGMGIAALISFAVFGLIDPFMFVYLVLFYLIAYFMMGSLMAAIGAAVNEVREAQTFMTPIMLVFMLPWIMWMPITQHPNSGFAVIMSFLPPINSFAMLLRMTSTQPPPGWQVWLSIAIGLAGAYASVWFAAKVFRVGLLMFGKPPNFKTLIRWVRMA